MTLVWRLTRRIHATPPTRAFDGVGAELRGGRWNKIGTRAAFASSTRSLAALEYLAHVDPERLPADLVFAGAALDDDAIQTSALPDDWDVVGSASAAEFGDRWLRRRRRLALSVPSVIIRAERNYVINPLHPDAEHLRVQPTLEPFSFDDRLIRR